MQTMKMINLKDLVPSITNPRRTFDKKKLDELTESILEKGVVQPILVRPHNGNYEIVSGERRYRASKAANLKDIPAMIKELDNKSAMEIQVIENLHRDDVHPLEEAEGYEMLLGTNGMTGIDDLAIKIGKSKSYIYGRMKLCSLIPEARKRFIEGDMSPSVALLIARIPASLQKEAMEEVLGNDWDDAMSYKRAKEHLEEGFMVRLDQAPFDGKDATLCPKAGACTVCPKRTGSAPDLFPDIKRSDICTDTDCFKLKKSTHFARKMQAAEKSGQTVLKTKDVFDEMYGNSPRRGFVSLTDTCYDDPKRRTYGQMIKKTDKKPALVMDSTGEVHEVIQRSLVINALKDAGVKLDNQSGHSPDHMAKMKKENRVKDTRRLFWISKVSTCDNEAVRNVIILDRILDHLGPNVDDILKGKGRLKNFMNGWSIPQLFEMGNDAVKACIKRAVWRWAQDDRIDDGDLEFLSEELGFTMGEDFVITQDYLDAMTKGDLMKLIKELGIDVTVDADAKKTGLIKIILDHAPKGKVPEELLKKSK